MKKQRIFTPIAVTLVTLLLSAGPAMAKKEKRIDFTATRTRTSGGGGPEVVDNCWLFRTLQLAYWTVTTDPGPVSHLVAGEWINFNTHYNREITAYVVDGVEVDCDPAVDPPEGATFVFGDRVMHGPFTLSPTGANGGVWQGRWESWGRVDGPPAITAVAEGIGGCLDGLKLRIFVEEGALVDAPFNGYIIFPEGYKKHSCDDDD